MWVPLSSKPLLDTLDMYPESLGVHLIIRYRHNGKVIVCPYPNILRTVNSGGVDNHFTKNPTIPYVCTRESELLSPQACLGKIRSYSEAAG